MKITINITKKEQSEIEDFANKLISNGIGAAMLAQHVVAFIQNKGIEQGKVSIVVGKEKMTGAQYFKLLNL